MSIQGPNEIETKLRSLPADEKARVQGICDAKIEAFGTFFAELGNGTLSRHEESVLRTYLIAELTGLLPSDR